jgi:hypothetical protein
VDVSTVVTSELKPSGMAGAAGFEPAYAGIKIPCLNQLGDAPVVGCSIVLLFVLVGVRHAASERRVSFHSVRD